MASAATSPSHAPIKSSAGYGRGRPLSAASSITSSGLPSTRPNSVQPQGVGDCWKCGGAHDSGVSNLSLSSSSMGLSNGRQRMGSSGFGLPVPNHIAGGNRDSQASNNMRRGGQDSTGCFRCGEQGHQQRDCRQPRLCYRCNQPGHTSNDCTNQPAQGRRPGPSKYEPKDQLETPTEKLFCEEKITPGANFQVMLEAPVKVTGASTSEKKESFSDMGLLRAVIVNIKKHDYDKPTLIQQLCIPHLMTNLDVAACAKTGSGKTAAFLIPIVHHLLSAPVSTQQISSNLCEPQALIFSPTRELAVQIYHEARKFSAGTTIEDRISCVYGGTSVDWAKEQMTRKEALIIIATIGRFKQYLSDGFVSLKRLRYIVLDEADRMLSFGFEHDIRTIFQHDDMPLSRDRVTMMFSATFPNEIQTLAKDFFKTGYTFIAVGEIGASNHDVVQEIIPVSKAMKTDKLEELVRGIIGDNRIKDPASGKDRFTKKVLVFAERIRTTDTLASYLCRSDLPSVSMNGAREQDQREYALQCLKDGEVGVLVATEVAARGLDIPLVDWVINYDLPSDITSYVHRVGRTGRVGNMGNAVSFFDDTCDYDIAKQLVDILTEANQVVPDCLMRYGMGAGNSANLQGFTVESRFNGQDTKGFPVEPKTCD